MILALHGNVGSTQDWDFLSHRNDITPIDLWQYSHLSLTEVADKLSQTGEARGIMGYSMGGRIALQSIVDHPEMWDFAIIISAHPGLECHKQKIQRLKSDNEWANYIKHHSWNDFLAKWNQQSVLTGPIPKTQRKLESRKTEIAAAFQNWSLGQQECLNDKINNCNKPIHWIVGENDDKFRGLAKDLSCDLTVAPNSGHRVLIDAPDCIVRSIADIK